MTEHPLFVFRWGDELGVRAWARAIGDDATVVLHHGPDDRWLRLDAPERFADWARTVAARLPACRSWISVQHLNRWPVERYVKMPSVASGRLLRAFDHQLAGHVLATATLREVCADATVESGVVEDLRAYELSGLLEDVLAAPARGVPRPAVGAHLRERKQRFDQTHPALTPRQRVIRAVAASAIPLDQALPRALGAVYDAAPAVAA